MSLSLRVVRHDKHVTSHTKILTASCWTDNYRELVGIDFLDNTPFDGGGCWRTEKKECTEQEKNTQSYMCLKECTEKSALDK